MSQERQGWGEEIKNSASASFKQEKKGVSHSAAAAQAAPAEKELKDTAVARGSSQHPPGQDRRGHPCWEGAVPTGLE